MADDNTRNPNVKQPGENPEGKFHYNPGNMAGKKPGDPEETAENRGELPQKTEKQTSPRSGPSVPLRLGRFFGG